MRAPANLLEFSGQVLSSEDDVGFDDRDEKGPYAKFFVIDGETFRRNGDSTIIHFHRMDDARGVIADHKTLSLTERKHQLAQLKLAEKANKALQQLRTREMWRQIGVEPLNPRNSQPQTDRAIAHRMPTPL